VQIQIGSVKAATSTYRREFLSGVPFMYTVDGLPAGQSASIALFGRTWKILRIVDGIPGTWSGAFTTPQAAIAGLALEINGELPSALSLPQPHDGIAKQHEDGGWSVYQVDFNGEFRLLEGPYDKEEAIARLRALVPVAEGDQWVIDVWGVAHTLN
jgi:hypothetical protein